MKVFLQAAVAPLLLFCAAVAPALAAGPVDAEVGALWWSNDVSTVGGSDTFATDASAPGYRGELWLFNRYGFRAGRYSFDLEELGYDTADHTSLDFMWKTLSFKGNNFLAMGVGWQQLDLPGIGLDGDTQGARLALEARIGIVGPLHFYAEGSYAPSLDDAPAINPGDGRFQNLKGREYDLGVSWKVAPFVHLRAGYRESNLDFTRVTPVGVQLDGKLDSSGYLLGLGVHF